MYANLLKSYDQLHFQILNELVNCVYDVLHMIMWWLEPQNQVEYMIFNFYNKMYMFHKTFLAIGKLSMVNKDD